MQEQFTRERELERKKYEQEKELEKQKMVIFYKKRLEEEMQKKEEEQRKLEEERKAQDAEREQKLREKIAREMDLKLNDTKNENEELAKQNRQMQEQVLEMTKAIRELRNRSDQEKIEMEKRLNEAQNAIREEEQKRLDEQYRMRILEKEKQLNDALRANDDLRRKLEQGSQQMQGEVLELQIESMLKNEFVFDDIEEVSKGIQGADLIQTVKDKYGRPCGRIVWEFKRTKSWSDGWISKLKDDQRNIKAEIAVIITQVLPKDVKTFTFRDGVWVASYDTIIGLAYALRSKLLEVSMIKQSSVGKNEKMEVLYEYLSGTEFKQRVEAIIESYGELQQEMEIEKRWFTKKWAKQEKMIRKVIDNTIGMHGELHSIMGRSLGEIKGLEMLPDGMEEEFEELPPVLNTGSAIEKEEKASSDVPLQEKATDDDAEEGRLF